MQVYESGAIFDPKVLDITDDDLLKTVKAGIANITAVSLGASIATIVAVPHLVINGFKNVLAVALETDYSFPLADKVCILFSAKRSKILATLLWLLSHKYLKSLHHSLAHVADVDRHPLTLPLVTVMRGLVDRSPVYQALSMCFFRFVISWRTLMHTRRQLQPLLRKRTMLPRLKRRRRRRKRRKKRKMTCAAPCPLPPPSTDVLSSFPNGSRHGTDEVFEDI